MGRELLNERAALPQGNNAWRYKIGLGPGISGKPFLPQIQSAVHERKAYRLFTLANKSKMQATKAKLL
jgi:hypothetical protein